MEDLRSSLLGVLRVEKVDGQEVTIAEEMASLTSSYLIYQSPAPI